MEHLVPIIPSYQEQVACPSCGSAQVRTKGVVLPGIHVLGDHECPACRLAFFQDLPVGFAVQFPVAFGKQDGRLFNIGNAAEWLHVPLLKAYASPNTDAPRIERIVHQRRERVVVLNCLDFLYGHVLLKLLNAQHYLDHHQHLGLIIILPRMFQWLVPKGVAEVWLVDLKLGAMHGWYQGIDAFFQQRLKEYQEVYMARGYAHPDGSRIDIGRFTGIAPFDPQEYDSRPKHITFIARRDRLWTSGPVQDLLVRGLARYQIREGIGSIPVARQNARIRETMRLIRKEYPDVSFTIVGLDDPGGYEGLATDLRTRRMDTERELAWCQAYAKSQIVVGVHGSNMLLPSAFAAGVVEVLPQDRQGNIVQDIFVRYTDRMQLFHYRFVREHATPAEVATHCISMFRYHGSYRRNMCEFTV